MTENQNTNQIDLQEYQVPIKQRWSCGYSQYAAITWFIAVGIGLFAATWFHRYLFGEDINIEGIATLSSVFSLIIITLSPVVLFISCVHACRRINRLVRNEKNVFYVEEIGKALQQILISCLKCALLLVCNSMAPLAAIIICLFVCIRTMKKLFIIS